MGQKNALIEEYYEQNGKMCQLDDKPIHAQEPLERHGVLERDQ
jgi:hypothetical protein